jgi:hypothetical protein
MSMTYSAVLLREYVGTCLKQVRRQLGVTVTQASLARRVLGETDAQRETSMRCSAAVDRFMSNSC